MSAGMVEGRERTAANENGAGARQAPTLFGGDLGNGVSDLWTALSGLSKKLPAADPGPSSSAVTESMITALFAVGASVPGMPSEVAAALRLIPYGSLAALAAVDTSGQIRARIADVVTAASGKLATAINAYTAAYGLVHSGGGSLASLPYGTIVAWDPKINRYRIAVPKTAAFGSALGAGSTSALIPAGSFKEVGTAAAVPPAAATVPLPDYTKAVSTPWYKAWWFWTPVGVVTAGAVVTTVVVIKRKRRRSA